MCVCVKQCVCRDGGNVIDVTAWCVWYFRQIHSVENTAYVLIHRDLQCVLAVRSLSLINVHNEERHGPQIVNHSFNIVWVSRRNYAHPCRRRHSTFPFKRSITLKTLVGRALQVTFRQSWLCSYIWCVKVSILSTIMLRIV